MKKILIIGGTSAIAEQCARIWAEKGNRIYLVAKNQKHMDCIISDLKVRGAPQVFGYCADINDTGKHSYILNSADTLMEGIDIVLIAHGTLPDQKSCQQNIEETFLAIKTNALSSISLLTLIANYFEAKQKGLVGIISSVAGDRGRESNYIYGSAKAMINTFASGLRQRFGKSKVTIVTIKPGFVDTPMTSSFKKGLLWTKPNTVAKRIVWAIDKKKKVKYTHQVFGELLCL